MAALVFTSPFGSLSRHVNVPRFISIISLINYSSNRGNPRGSFSVIKSFITKKKSTDTEQTKGWRLWLIDWPFRRRIRNTQTELINGTIWVPQSIHFQLNEIDSAASAAESGVPGTRNFAWMRSTYCLAMQLVQVLLPYTEVIGKVPAQWFIVHRWRYLALTLVIFPSCESKIRISLSISTEYQRIKKNETKIERNHFCSLIN